MTIVWFFFLFLSLESLTGGDHFLGLLSAIITVLTRHSAGSALVYISLQSLSETHLSMLVWLLQKAWTCVILFLIFILPACISLKLQLSADDCINGTEMFLSRSMAHPSLAHWVSQYFCVLHVLIRKSPCAVFHYISAAVQTLSFTVRCEDPLKTVEGEHLMLCLGRCRSRHYNTRCFCVTHTRLLLSGKCVFFYWTDAKWFTGQLLVLKWLKTLLKHRRPSFRDRSFHSYVILLSIIVLYPPAASNQIKLRYDKRKNPVKWNISFDTELFSSSFTLNNTETRSIEEGGSNHWFLTVYTQRRLFPTPDHYIYLETIHATNMEVFKTS